MNVALIVQVACSYDYIVINFDSKTCAYDELICVVHHVMVSLMCTNDVFLCVVHVYIHSVP